MADAGFSSLFQRLIPVRRKIAAGIVVLMLLAAAGLFFIPFRHSMETMLPSGSDALQATRVLQSLDFSAKVAVSLSLRENETDRSELFAAADRFSASLEPPLVTQVLSTFDTQEMIRDMGAFLERAPELLGEDDLQRLEASTTREGVARQLRKKYVQLLKPEGSFMAPMIQRDPFDLQMTLVERFSALSGSFGYDIRMENNHLVSEDGQSVLLVLETGIPFTDAAGSRELIDYLGTMIGRLPSSINAEMVCGHLHTLSNEKVIRRDVNLTAMIAGAAFILLFLLFFRDWRALLIFLIPFGALLLAVNMAAVILGTLSPMMLGFGAVVCGVAVDYGIHVYVAVNRSPAAAAAVRSVARPVLLGALTTACVFAAFFFSSIPGYTQLALFALLSVLFSVIGALCILPIYLKPRSNAENAKEVPPKEGYRDPCVMPDRCSQEAKGGSRFQNYVVAGAFFILMVIAVPYALQARFDSDVMQLDGTEQAVLDTEERFRDTWGGGSADQAVAMVTAVDREAALELNDRLYETLAEKAAADRAASLSPVWKSYASRVENAARWNRFWSSERIETLKTFFEEEGAQYDFTPDAFDPFFDSLRTYEVQEQAPSDNQLFDHVVHRFVVTFPEETRIFSYFPDRPELLAALEDTRETIPGLMLISRSAIAASLAADYTREFSRITLIALGLVLLVAGVFLKNWRKVLVVLAPAGAGVLGVACLARAAGTDLNVMNLVSGIIVIGLCVDYGIFRVHAYTKGLRVGTRTAISLSAGTTLIGAGALLFTNHPALFSVGLTLAGGILAGYLTSLFAVPSLCSLFLQKELS